MPIPNLKWFLYPHPHIGQQRLRERFSGRWVVVTGASSGIGKALTLRLMEAGANLCLIARREEILQSLCHEAERCGCQAFYYATDLREHEALRALCQELAVRLPRVDYLFCNAGKSIQRTITDAADRLHDYDRTMEVNYRSMVALSLALLPLLKAASGRIVYTSSVSTLYPAAPGWSAYHASKTAANVWCQTADAELASLGIRVKIAYMPLVHTPMSDVNVQYLRLPGYSAEEAATLLLRLSQSRSSSYKPWWAWLSAPVAQLFSPLIRFIYRHL